MRKALLTTIGIPLTVTALLAATLPAVAVIAALWPHDVGGGDEDPYSLDGHTVSHATYSPHALYAMQGEGITEGDVEQAMQGGISKPGYRGRTVYYDPDRDVTIVVRRLVAQQPSDSNQTEGSCNAQNKCRTTIGVQDTDPRGGSW